MDENLYDEFGNYTGPELESEGDESESEAASESEGEEVRRAVQRPPAPDGLTRARSTGGW